MIIQQTFNELYEPMFVTNKRYIDLWGGRGRGGSFTGTDYFLFLITQPNYFRGYFIRQAFSDIRNSLFRDFKDRITDNDTLDINDFSIQENAMSIEYKPTGNLIMSKGVKKDGSRTAKMKSLAGATHVLIEEADELGEEDFDQLDLSLRTVKTDKVQIIRIFNPPFKQHWIWRDYILTEAQRPVDYTEKEFLYFKASPKTDSDICSIFSTYNDNIENIQPSTVDRFEKFKLNKPEYYYTTIKGLISEGQKGRVFKNWKPISNDDFNAIDARTVYGLDFGVTTGGLVAVKIVKNQLYLRELNYEGGTDKEIAIKMAKLGITKSDLIIADSADPLKIAKLRRGWRSGGLSKEEEDKYPQLMEGFYVLPVVKVSGSIKFGIELMKEFDTYVTEDSSNIWVEYRNYKYALDKNKNPTDDPEDDNNHLIDPSRYVVMSKGSKF